jgi:hypothetical protein
MKLIFLDITRTVLHKAIAQDQDCRFLWYPSPKNTSASAIQIGTLVLLTTQHEVCHCRARHGQLPSPTPPDSSRRAILPYHSCDPKVSSSELSSNRNTLGRRHLGTIGPHHLGHLFRHDCSNKGSRTNTLDNTTSPRAGPYQHGWNIGPNQRSSSHLGGGCSDVPNIYLRSTSIEGTNHQYV